MLDRFHLRGAFARGGMGDLWLADDLVDGREILLKTVREDLNEDDDVRVAFEREIEVTARLRHAGVVRHIAHGFWNGRAVLAMEHIQGRALDQLAHPRLPLDAVLAVAIDVADALAYVHALRDDTGSDLSIVHGDVSPQNVLIDMGGRAHLIDFGAATLRGMRRDRQLVCKPGYVSPEQADGDIVDARSDQYSLGVLLWEMIVGRELFGGDGARRGRPIPPVTSFTEVPASVEATVFRMLALDRNARFQDITAVADALAAALPAPREARELLGARARGARGVRHRPAAQLRDATSPTLHYPLR